MICKSTLDKLGKAAFNSLSPEDQAKYTTASKVVAIVSDVVKNGYNPNTLPDVGNALAEIGFNVGSTALIALARSLSGEDIKTLGDAIRYLSGYVVNSIASLIDQVKHELAARLAVLFGINENPGILGAVMEWVFKSIIKPTLKIA